MLVKMILRLFGVPHLERKNKRPKKLQVYARDGPDYNGSKRGLRTLISDLVIYGPSVGLFLSVFDLSRPPPSPGFSLELVPRAAH